MFKVGTIGACPYRNQQMFSMVRSCRIKILLKRSQEAADVKEGAIKIESADHRALLVCHGHSFVFVCDLVLLWVRYDSVLAGHLYKRCSDSSKWLLRWFRLYQVRYFKIFSIS